MVSTSSPDEVEGERDPAAPVVLEFGAAPLLLSEMEKSDQHEEKQKQAGTVSNEVAIGHSEKIAQIVDRGWLDGVEKK